MKKTIRIIFVNVITLFLMLLAGCTEQNSIPETDYDRKDETLADQKVYLSDDWRGGFLNQEIIHDDEIQRICFIDLSTESAETDAEVLMGNAIGDIFYPKDKKRSSEKSGDLYAWITDENDQYTLYFAAEGGIWAPEDCHGFFHHMNNLEYIRFNGAFHTDNVTDMSYMFQCCKELKEVDVNNLNTEKVEDMNSMFNDCESLEKLDVSQLDTQNVSNMMCMFAYCTNLTSLTLGEMDTSNVTNMSGMFTYLTNLHELDVSPLNTSNVANMQSMFYGCEKVTEIDVTGFDTKKVINMKGMFSSCSSLEKVDIGGFDLSSIEEAGMELMFSGCEHLVSIGDVDIPYYADPDNTAFMGVHTGL